MTPPIYTTSHGDDTFTDATLTAGFGGNRQYVGWGCGFIDYDNDGWPDVMQINGHVYPEVDSLGIAQTFKNPRLVYRNLAGKTFEDVSSKLGSGILERYSSRGAAFGDFDNDGDVDVLIMNMNDLPSLLLNDGGNKNNWIKIKLFGTKCNRTAIGARVRVVAGDHSQINEVASGGSVMSQSDFRLHFGLGKAKLVDLIEVKWPTTQKVQRFTNIQANQILALREGMELESWSLKHPPGSVAPGPRSPCSPQTFPVDFCRLADRFLPEFDRPYDSQANAFASVGLARTSYGCWICGTYPGARLWKWVCADHEYWEKPIRVN